MFKFLDASLATHYKGVETVYPVPAPGEKWGPWLEHPEPVEPDGGDCGPGGYHLMKVCSAEYAPINWWPWWAEGDGLVGESARKARYHRVRLRRISPAVWYRALCLGWGRSANLRSANLSDANLRNADLRNADLSDANLSDANLRNADLRNANLSDANLSDADLRYANLRNANLSDANLSDADLRYANLSDANLRYANLSDANLSDANLSDADLRYANLWNANLSDAITTGAIGLED
jgi:hypothetical protein